MLPFLIYTIAKSSLGDVHALLIASVPPLARGIIVFALTRRIDALSILALFGIVLSLLAFVIGFIGGKPLIYQLSRATIKRRSAAEAASFETLQDKPVFRRAMMIMTLTWGISLVVEAAISYVLTFVLTVQQFLLVNPIMGYSSFGALTAWTYWYARREIRALRERS